MEGITSKYVTMKNHIRGAPDEADFELRSEVVVPGSGDMLVKMLCVAIDPYQLNRMKRHSWFHKSVVSASALSPGQAINGHGVGRVVASGNPECKEGDLVSGLLCWGEYCLVKKGDAVRKLDPMGFPLSYHLGILGLSGLSAYIGLFGICKPRKGEKVFVSSAAGSVGNVVGQYAKLLGCYVVGSVGTQKKVKLLKETLGFDDAFNYNEEPDLNAALKRCFPEGIDVYFDNVGAQMLTPVVANMNAFGRVAACGAISEYTAAQGWAAPSMVEIVYKRIKIQGFLCADHMDVQADFLSTTREHLRMGRMRAVEDVSRGLESIPSAFVGLFRGDNIGKTVVRIAEDD